MLLLVSVSAAFVSLAGALGLSLSPYGLLLCVLGIVVSSAIGIAASGLSLVGVLFVLVYVGAILVVVLHALLLLGLPLGASRFSLVSVLMAFLAAFLLGLALWVSMDAVSAYGSSSSAFTGHRLGSWLLGDGAVWFMLLGILLCVGLVAGTGSRLAP
jgi:NADH:ubiquinone oxidoreductase subunit 6 (subunit J)